MLAQPRGVHAAHRAFTVVLVALAVGVQAGCAPRRPETPAAPAPSAVTPPLEAAIPAGARVYVVDPQASQVTIQVRRAGPLARLGHNHVITSADESGLAWTTGVPAQSGFVVRMPVSGLVVDDPEARAAAGPDFPGEVPADAREGTKRNMLRPEVLDGDRYPEIVVRADAFGGTWERPVAEARITLRDQARPVSVPLAIQRDDVALVARGSFQVLQSDFGITPFSVAGGAIQVADQVQVSFEIRATAR
jgi:hypothetical protein